ncbi:uncharacterized protein LOC131939461 [Physella acuta]|uniref:uncharacterized protein LOC131939461 n=1 Tax=Physella acuta TaxID=109671 RepID=UPI0027DE4B34|nr:uncharacterized protein LOC131939461 [Physella acuta]
MKVRVLPLLLLVTWIDQAVTVTPLLNHMTYSQIEDYKNHPCTRSCTDDGQPMTCDYNFLVEHYHTLTKACWNCPITPDDCYRPHCVYADGGQRGIITVNRMMPGPSIQVCENDTIRVRVHNKMEQSEGTSIHWHGVLQHGTPYMDGVAMVTQCPIPAHSSFTYVFKASTPGTHFWHAHSGLQRADGVFGHLIIRQTPSRELHNGFYDLDLPEHAILVTDWWQLDSPPSFARHHHSNGTNKPTTVLINGKGRLESPSGPITKTPLEVFRVTPGKRYRFRVASNGILNCPLTVSVDGHVLEVIASDGQPVKPVAVKAFVIFAGERYDFVLTANQSVGQYLLRVQGQLDCGPAFNNATQTAIVIYDGAEDNKTVANPPPVEGKLLNPVNSGPTNTTILVSELRSMRDDDVALTRAPDVTFVLAMDFKAIDNPRFHNPVYYNTRDFPQGKRQLQTPQINDISNMLPPVPALPQYSQVPQDMLCSEVTKGKNCSVEYCECLHLLKVQLGQVVEMFLIDQGHIWNASHPTHLHGHGFRVLAMDRLDASIYAKYVMDLDKAGNITRNLRQAPIKDTVTIPDGGYTLVRFVADNPGMWFLHCHIEYHVEIGMGVLIQVGEPSEFPPVPKGFPTCGSWEPEEPEEPGPKSSSPAVTHLTFACLLLLLCCIGLIL